MFVLRLTTFTLLICVVSARSFAGGLFHWFSDCNPPYEMIGKFCVIVTGLDFNFDGTIDRTDFAEGILRFNTDDDTCSITRSEMVTGYDCQIGMTAEFARWRFNQLDRNNDGILDKLDFTGTLPNFTFDELLYLQLTRYRDEFCITNITNVVDTNRCEEAKTIKREDLKCNKAP